MFSEYASRFLAQSQSRLSLGQPDTSNMHRTPERQRSSRFPASRSYLQRPTMNNRDPSGSQLSRFPFSSRAAQPQAPLFYSATDDFREEDDAEEHAREVADHYALARSRRNFGSTHLSESSEVDDEGGDSSIDQSGEPPEQDGYRRGRGIRSSWRGTRSTRTERPVNGDGAREQEARDHSSGPSEDSSRGRGNLVDVELASTVRDSIDHIGRDDLEDIEEEDDQPPAFQQFRNGPHMGKSPFHSTFLPHETDEEAALGRPRPPSPDRESVPPGAGGDFEAPAHDAFWARLFWICLSAVFASFILTWFHNSKPKNIGDTVYSVLHASYHMLAVDTLVAAIVAMLWISLLRSFVRPLVVVVILATPVTMLTFSIYSLASSGKAQGGIQEKVMWWASFIPGVLTFVWIYLTYQSRHAIEKATDLLEFACRILASSPALMLLGFGTLAMTIVWTWTFIGMFTRIFLGGHFATGRRTLFVVDVGTWWLGAAFILMYLWSRAVISGVQRATTAATVSNWYFHRYSTPASASNRVVQDSLRHSLNTMFGTICLSSFAALAVRLPLLVLPRRLAGFVTLWAYALVPTSVATLTNPLTLTYAAIHSQPLSSASRGISSLSFMTRDSATTTLTPQTTNSALVPYRLAKLLLIATRGVVSLALGFAGWVIMSRAPNVVEAGVKGSLYAYIVGLIAGFIGWGVLGSMEGVIAMILDAVVVCWGSEINSSAGEVRYCREAGELFGERGRFY